MKGSPRLFVLNIDEHGTRCLSRRKYGEKSNHPLRVVVDAMHRVRRNKHAIPRTEQSLLLFDPLLTSALDDPEYFFASRMPMESMCSARRHVDLHNQKLPGFD